MEDMIRQNAVIFLLNAVKRNKDRQFRAHYRRQRHTEYMRGCMKRNQILREQFGARHLRLGVLQTAGRPRGRPRGSTGGTAERRQQPGHQAANNQTRPSTSAGTAGSQQHAGH